MSKGRRQKKMTKPAIYTERLKLKPEKEETKKKEPVKISMQELQQQRRASEQKIVRLSKGDYAKHKKARNIMALALGKTSDMFHRKEIDSNKLFTMQEEAAKKAIRLTNLLIAKKAWIELLDKVINLPGRRANGVVILCQPMVNYWAQFGCPRMIMDAPEPPKTDIEEKEEPNEQTEESGTEQVTVRNEQ